MLSGVRPSRIIIAVSALVPVEVEQRCSVWARGRLLVWSVVWFSMVGMELLFAVRRSFRILGRVLWLSKHSGRLSKRLYLGAHRSGFLALSLSLSQQLVSPCLVSSRASFAICPALCGCLCEDPDHATQAVKSTVRMLQAGAAAATEGGCWGVEAHEPQRALSERERERMCRACLCCSALVGW